MGSDSTEKRPYVHPRVRSLSPAEKLVSPSTKTRPTLILAEDHPEFADYFVGILKDHFNIVAIVTDGDTLVELVNQRKPDAIVSDVGLKGLNGIAATMKIRQHDPDVPIVLMTASTDSDLRIGGLTAGASAFLSKSESAHKLVALLRHFLERANPR
jgi:DNA-binding NarL/FixJ family response regulator